MQKEDKLLDHNYDGIQELDNQLPPWWLYLFYITIIWGVGYFFYYHVFEMGDLMIDEYKREMGEVVEEKSSKGIFDGYQSPYSRQPAGSSAEIQTAGPAQPEGSVKTETAESAPVDYELVTDPDQLKNGAAVFSTNCVACHGKLGEGGIGPNLTDNYWIHGDGKFNAIVKVIQEGVPVKGMISWRPILSEKDLIDVASHVYNLAGTNPPNAKAPQGEKYGE